MVLDRFRRYNGREMIRYGWRFERKQKQEELHALPVFVLVFLQFELFSFTEMYYSNASAPRPSSH